jgi:hypothetical protein
MQSINLFPYHKQQPWEHSLVFGVPEENEFKLEEKK